MIKTVGKNVLSILDNNINAEFPDFDDNTVVVWENGLVLRKYPQ